MSVGDVDRQGVATPALLMAPPSTEEVKAFADWLGVEADEGGGVVSLPEHARVALAVGYVQEIIPAEDVLVDGTALSLADFHLAHAMWQAYYADSIAAAKATARKSDLLKLERWMKARFLDEGEMAASKASSKMKEVPAQAKEDMAFQGACELWQIGYAELALALAWGFRRCFYTVRQMSMSYVEIL